MISVSVDIKDKKLTKNIDRFTDKVVYNVAVLTREMTKGLRAYPRRTGRLEQTEVSEQITGSNKEYGLSAGVAYAKYVWLKGRNTNWTNSSTEPQWYYTVFDKHDKEIVHNAVNRALKEL